MKKILLLPVIYILLFCAPAFADFAKGLNAAQKGDFVTALKEWKPLAEQGNSAAQHNLGWMYDNGHGVIQNYKTAIKYYTLAAEQGNSTAQHNLGWMHDNGQGFIQNYTRAHMWYNISASLGFEGAVKNRDIIAKKMTPSQIEKAQTLASECVAKNYKGC
jgi:TPR repeat protein